MPPSEIASGFKVIGAFALLAALYFLWEIRREGSNFGLTTIWYYVRFTATFHISVLLICSVYFDWFDLEQITPVYWTVLDTMLKGALLDVVESYDLDISSFEPDNHLFWWRTISFLFRSAYGLVLPAIGVRAFQLWKKEEKVSLGISGCATKTQRLRVNGPDQGTGSRGANLTTR